MPAYVRGQHINAAALFELRTEAGYTQGALSRASGVGQSYISQLELGHRKVVGPPTARKLAKALGVKVSDITLTDRRQPLLTPAPAGAGA